MQSSFIFLFIISSLSAFADVRLPAILSDHMVLQQHSEVNFWGWCEPGEKIKIKTGWDTTTYNAVGTSSAKWLIKIQTPVAGGPYSISVIGNNTIQLQDVLIGEVWVCSGQSNMEMSMNWGLPYESDAANANNQQIRFFHIPRTTALFPQEDVKARWVVCNTDDMKRFSAVGYFFGSTLQQNLHAPVGLINSSWGGTHAEAWSPSDLVENDAELRAAAAQLKPSNGWPVVPGATYNAMIYPLTNFAIAGAIWYQGESNVGTAATYQSLFTSMIGRWRRAWSKDFPFYFVQIAPFAGYGDNSSSAFLREAQTLSARYPNTGMVLTSDLVDNINDIHPKMKKEVGLRLANYALAQTYGKTGLVFKSPLYQSMKVEKDRIRISFDNVPKGLMTKGPAPTEFYIAGTDQKFLPASAKIEGNTVVVSNPSIKSPVAVRFGFRNAAQPDLFSKEGLPVNLFRTDNWPVEIIVGK